MADPEISVVVPLFNEEANLPPLTEAIEGALSGTGRTWELLYVDDGSRDGSLEVLRSLAATREEIRVLALARNQGQSAALGVGIRASRGAIVLTLDADLQNDPTDFPRLLEELEHCDLVSGIRSARQDSWLRKVSSRVANRVRRRITRDTITDVGCSLKAYRREFLEQIPWFNGVHRFLPALCQARGARVREIEVAHHPRAHGISKYGLQNRLWRGIRDLLGVRWLLDRQVDVADFREL